MSFTMAGSLLLARAGVSALQPGEATSCLELHPPNPYTQQRTLEEGNFWAMEFQEGGGEPQTQGLPDVWGLEAPRAVELPEMVGLAKDVIASPMDELTVAVLNHALELFLVRLDARGTGGVERALAVKEAILVDRSPYGPEGIAGVCWSRDGRWLAYTRQAAQDLPCPTGIYIYDTKAQVRPKCITCQHFEESSPAFDPKGEYLAFLSKRALRPVADEVTGSVGFGAAVQRPFLLLLRAHSRNPLQRWPRAPAEQEEDSEEDGGGGNSEDEGHVAEVHIEADGAADRVVELPVRTGRYLRVAAIEDGLVYLREDPSKPVPKDEDEEISGTVLIYRFTKARETTVASGVLDFEVSMDGNSLLLQLEEARVKVISVEHAGEPSEDEEDGGQDGDEEGEGEEGGTVSLEARISLEVDPMEEWVQIFRETWRSVGMHFYDKAMGGVDWLAMRARYEPVLPRLGCRADLTDLLSEMCGELGASHLCVSGPDEEPGGNAHDGGSLGCEQGFLGANLLWDGLANGYRVAKVIHGDVWSAELGGPLARAHVPEGALLLAINRQRLSASTTVEKLLANAAGCDVYLTVAMPGKGPPALAAPGASGGGAGSKTTGKVKAKGKRTKRPGRDPPLTQTVRVRCASHESDQLARYRDWVEGNCRLVHAATEGRIGYLHVPNCDGNGFAYFHRYHLTECNREAVVLDIRGNDGGYISEAVLDRLTRAPLGVTVPRAGQGRLAPYPARCLRNARTAVLLADAWSCSDAEVLAASFRDLGLGSIVGMRTWGGVLSVGDFDLEHVDGGEVTIPSDNLFSLKGGGFTLENHGVEPDIEVDMPPDSQDWTCGVLDSQLRAAVAEAERLLAARAVDAAAVAANCRQLPHTREHLHWHVLGAQVPQE